jgi:hypothetical protein
MKRFFYINKRYIKEFVKGSAEIFIITLVVYIFGLLFLLVGKVLNLIPNVKDLTPILSTVMGVLLGLYIEKIRLAWKRASLKSAVILELKVVIGELIIYFLECYFLNMIRFHPGIRESFKALEKLMYLYFSDSFKSFNLKHIRKIENLVEDMESIEWVFEMIKKYEDTLPKFTREKLHDFLVFRRTLYQVFENIKTFKETFEIEKFREELRKTIDGKDIYLLGSFDERFDYRYKKDDRQYTPIETYFIKEANIESLNDVDPSFAVRVLYILKNLDKINKEILSALASNYCTDVNMYNMKLLISEIEDLIAK